MRFLSVILVPYFIGLAVCAGDVKQCSPADPNWGVCSYMTLKAIIQQVVLIEAIESRKLQSRRSFDLPNCLQYLGKLNGCFECYYESG